MKMQSPGTVSSLFLLLCFLVPVHSTKLDKVDIEDALSEARTYDDVNRATLGSLSDLLLPFSDEFGVGFTVEAIRAYGAYSDEMLKHLGDSSAQENVMQNSAKFFAVAHKENPQGLSDFVEIVKKVSRMHFDTWVHFIFSRLRRTLDDVEKYDH